MDYKALNENQRKRMLQISKNDFSMEWENPDFLDALIGKLPPIHHDRNEENIKTELAELNKYYSQFDFFATDRAKFIQQIKVLINVIHNKNANWYGLDLYRVEECIRQQEFCLISGEGGIGKSYFIKCLEEEFERNGIPHLCIYGKFEKNLQNVDVNEVAEVGEKGFVFIVDAINEMSEKGQIELLNVLRNLVHLSKIRIILTYRTNAMDNQILEGYKEMAKAECAFPGVSFESALNELLKMSVPDVYKYEDILFSNNALLLNMLCRALSDEKLIEEKVNSVASITFILEYYIKNSIKKTFKGEISSTDPIEIWKDIKRVAKWMYEQDVKGIDKENLLIVIKSGDVFIRILRQAGIIGEYDYDDRHYYFFAIDSLTDFLIARSLFEDITGKAFDEQVRIISQKTGKLYNMEEAVILAIFDNLAPDYEYIAKLLKETKLMDSLQYETLVKINFSKENIVKFIKAFEPIEKNSLITIFGGYTDKPFNCVNYLNSYYTVEKNQLRELSLTLSGTHFLGRVKGRLKNIIYFLTLNNGKERRVEEAFYYALWCCAAPNKDVRCLAMKLLYEVVRQNTEYKSVLIDMYESIVDPYIKESIIYVLVNYLQDDEEILSFFKNLIIGETYLLARSIKRIAVYLQDDYGYIKWDRENLYDLNNVVPISDSLNDIFFSVDLMNKDFLPFRYWSKEHIDMHTRFLQVDKQDIFKLNHFLEEKFLCVKTGECNGLMSFENHIKSEYNIDLRKQVLDNNAFFASFESVIKEIFSLFQEPYDEIERIGGEEEFQNSIFMKSVDVATGIYYGSLMCNYFTNEFATYNNYQNSIGYEVYDPIEYGEDVYIATPVPTYQDYIEKLGDMVINRIDLPEKKDLEWVRDVSNTRRNLVSLFEAVEIKSVEWVLLAGRVSLHEDSKKETRWKDTYDIWCCTSEKETIHENGGARYLTIELEDYAGNLGDYKKCDSKPWLCKDVKNINYHSEIFDNTSLVLPPAELICYFQLTPVYANMSWINSAGEVVIFCNNNKNSYYTDPIGGTVFIRKDYLDEYRKGHILKYFAFTERFIPETGYADETSLHFEIKNGVIIKEILNNGGGFHRAAEINPLCANCPHGFNQKLSNNNSDLNEMIEIILREDYTSWEEDEIN